MVTEVDENGDGEIDFEEFTKAMRHNGQMNKTMNTAVKRLDWQKHFCKHINEVAAAASMQQAKARRQQWQNPSGGAGAASSASSSSPPLPPRQLTRQYSYDQELQFAPHGHGFKCEPAGPPPAPAVPRPAITSGDWRSLFSDEGAPTGEGASTGGASWRSLGSLGSLFENLEGDLDELAAEFVPEDGEGAGAGASGLMAGGGPSAGGGVGNVTEHRDKRIKRQVS
jgi:hypothetical protein